MDISQLDHLALPCLVAIGLVQVEVWMIQYVMWPHHVIGDQVTMWVIKRSSDYNVSSPKR